MNLKNKIRKLKQKISQEEDISIDEALEHRKLNKQKSVRKNESLLTISIFISIVLILTTSIYTGYMAYHEGRGGYIYGLDVTFKRPTFSWGGIYGSAFGVGQSQPWEFELDPGGMIEANMFFDCVERDKKNLLFASHVPEHEVSVPSLVAATPQEIDQLIGIDDSFYDSALNTFTETMNINLGGRVINNIPAVHTRVGTGTNISTFTTGLLIDDNGNYVFVAELNEVLVRGFNNRFYNYQFLLPIVGNETTDYYIFIDPYNVCLGGDDEPSELGGIYGQVTDISGNPLENVLIVVGTFSTVTDAGGNYNFTAEIGPRKIFAILTGYRVYEGDVNVTLNEYTEHNIILELDTPPVDYTDTGPDVGPDFGPDQGPDQGPGDVPFQIERPVEIEGQDYWIPFNRITKRIREGEFTQETIFIQSFRQGTMQVNIEITGDVAKIISIDRQSLQIPNRGDGRVTLTFFGNESPGFYNGTANLTGDIEVEIPILVEIIDRDKIPIQALLIGLSMSDNRIFSGDKINFRTDLTNLLTDRGYPVRLLYTIQDLEGTETIWSHTSNVFLETSLSILQTVELPSNLREGDYVIRVTADYLSLSSQRSKMTQLPQGGLRAIQV